MQLYGLAPRRSTHEAGTLPRVKTPEETPAREQFWQREAGHFSIDSRRVALAAL